MINRNCFVILAALLLSASNVKAQGCIAFASTVLTHTCGTDAVVDGLECEATCQRTSVTAKVSCKAGKWIIPSDLSSCSFDVSIGSSSCSIPNQGVPDVTGMDATDCGKKNRGEGNRQDSFPFPDELCHLTCGEGYEAEEDVVATCMSTGTFQLSKPLVCNSKVCDISTIGANISDAAKIFNTTDCATTKTTEICSVSCGADYTGEINDLTCKENGSFEGDLPTCKEFKRTTPTTVATTTTVSKSDNGLVSGTNQQQAFNTLFSCAIIFLGLAGTTIL